MKNLAKFSVIDFLKIMQRSYLARKDVNLLEMTFFLRNEKHSIFALFLNFPHIAVGLSETIIKTGVFVFGQSVGYGFKTKYNAIIIK